MINCMTPAEMSYFIELMGDIISILGTEGSTIVVHATEGDVFWERTGDMFCRMLDVKL